MLDKLAMRMLERKLESRRNKRQRRTSSTDEEDLIDDDEVTLEMLNEAKSDLNEAVKKISEKIDAAFGKLDSNTKSIAQNKKEITNSKNDVDSLRRDIDILRRESREERTSMKKELENNKKDIEKMKKDLHEIRKERDGIREERKRAERRMIDLEARSRRNNLIFYGVPEQTDEDCHQVIIKFLSESLKIDASGLMIHRAHRIGAPRRGGNSNTVFVGSKANAPRPLIVCFADFKQREMIRHKRFDLTRPFGVSEDLPIEIRNARKSLDGQIRALKLSGKKCAILYPCRLLVDGKIDNSVNVDIADFVENK